MEIWALNKILWQKIINEKQLKYFQASAHFPYAFDHVVNTMPTQPTSKIKGLVLGLPQMGNSSPGAYLIIIGLEASPG